MERGLIGPLDGVLVHCKEFIDLLLNYLSSVHNRARTVVVLGICE